MKGESTLKNIDVDIASGSFVAIVGPTGSGKTSFLSAIIGLMQKVNGPSNLVHGKLVFVPQTPYIFNATVRENILFGNAFDERRYFETIRVASLIEDLEMLPAGDKTELGERGINVSGGQKQRIALARAMYSDADVCLLDDPLSALDANVGRDVFYNLIKEALKDKTVILVTNQLNLVNVVDRIYFLQNGEIVEKGTYDELMKIERSGFVRMMEEAAVENDSDPYASKKVEENSSNDIDARILEVPGTDSDEQDKLVQNEGRTQGIDFPRAFRGFISAMGGWIVFTPIFMIFFICEALRMMSSVWLANWTRGETREHGDEYYIGIYVLLLGIQILLNFLCQLTGVFSGLKASMSLYKKMISKILRAPMSFYHATPIGRIINRFTNDMDEIDKRFSKYLIIFSRLITDPFLAFYAFSRNLLMFASSFIVVSIFLPITVPFSFIILPLMVYCFIYYRSTSRGLKQMNAVSKSPIYSSINDVLNGLGTIRAFGSEKRMIERHMRLVDRSIALSLMNLNANHWLMLRLEVLSGLMSLVTALVAIERDCKTSVMGLTITVTLMIGLLTNVIAFASSTVETGLNAVARVTEYGELEEEALAFIPGSAPDHWPDEGAVIFDNIKMKYRPGLPLVLKGLSAKIEPVQRVGIVGRTGAGYDSTPGLFLFYFISGNRL